MRRTRLAWPRVESEFTGAWTWNTTPAQKPVRKDARFNVNGVTGVIWQMDQVVRTVDGWRALA